LPERRIGYGLVARGERNARKGRAHVVVRIIETGNHDASAETHAPRVWPGHSPNVSGSTYRDDPFAANRQRLGPGMLRARGEYSAAKQNEIG
jgi:hypothetical protein